MIRACSSLVAALLLGPFGACAPGPDERVDADPPPGAVGEQAVALTNECENPVAGYRIRYPAGWRTNAGDVMTPCTLFDPGPIVIEPGTELPFDIAVSVHREPVPLATITGEGHGENVLLREETIVEGRDAMRMEFELTEDLLRPAGSRTYQYVVELGDDSLVVSTHDEGELPFALKQRIVDEMVATVRFTGVRDRE